MSIPTTSIDQLKRAITIAEQIEQLQAELNAILGGQAAAPQKSAPAQVLSKGKRSPEVRAKMAAAQKARWARVHGAKSSATAAKPVTAPKKKRNLTPEGRARLAASMKARWEAKKAAKTPTPEALEQIASAGQPAFSVL